MDISGIKTPLVLRTDFSDDAAWESISSALQAESADGFRSIVTCVSDRQYDGLTVERLISTVLEGNHSFVFIVDPIALTHPERPILVVDLHEEPGRTFRVIPGAMWGVENNLSLANMDFGELAASVDPDGIFRGVP
jgi:hypothetical protein